MLSWRVVSADGHPVGGVVIFAVGHPSAASPAPPVDGDRAVQAAIWIAQFVLYVGLFVGVGGAAFAAWLAAARPMPGERHYRRASWGAVLVAAVVVAAAPGPRCARHSRCRMLGSRRFGPEDFKTS